MSDWRDMYTEHATLLRNTPSGARDSVGQIAPDFLPLVADFPCVLFPMSAQEAMRFGQEYNKTFYTLLCDKSDIAPTPPYGPDNPIATANDRVAWTRDIGDTVIFDVKAVLERNDQTGDPVIEMQLAERR